VRLVFAGTPAVALPALDLLLATERHEVVAVVTRPDRPAGRGRTLAASPVKERAVAAGVPVLQPARAGDPAFLDELRTLAPDCCPVVAYGALLPPAALAVPRLGWVNLHFSLLPAWRGAAPVQHAVLAGDEVTGASTFRIEEGLDTGPVFGTFTTEIGARETAGDLLDRLAADGAGLLLATLDGLADGTLEARPQPADGVSLAPKLTADDARVVWTAPALRVDRQIRACTPSPGAWTTYDGRRVKLGPVTPVEADGEDLAPGEIAVSRNGVRAGTGSGPVLLGDIRPEGRAVMAAADWARGARLGTGARFA
jgi:methionyl-tRNA formyltransferase